MSDSAVIFEEADRIGEQVALIAGRGNADAALFVINVVTAGAGNIRGVLQLFDPARREFFDFLPGDTGPNPITGTGEFIYEVREGAPMAAGPIDVLVDLAIPRSDQLRLKVLPSMPLALWRYSVAVLWYHRTRV